MTNHTKHDSIRAELQTRLDHLMKRAQGIDSELSEPGDTDWEERATEMEDDEVLATLGNIAVKEITEIREAIGRIDKGTYGVCSRCKKAIPAERLDAVPYAKTCTACI
ncbi:transcriptional regulator, TraR/DksA family [Neorhodopirellula lusitana]|uniref:Transcriptional regulator, TraR/DksA family n=1 Tax=Neorhodopirellula lusitana TaxID=445327 RepID=A0ABY1QJW7_9BACT|nr:TraR/DksA family transcriptional regulator [Neorhodopirellula lusitana]SMP73811.1 transcriptional regulator, TraR/DksA family [Neorhodopirellula lusitana]